MALRATLSISPIGPTVRRSSRFLSHVSAREEARVGRQPAPLATLPVGKVTDCFFCYYWTASCAPLCFPASPCTKAGEKVAVHLRVSCLLLCRRASYPLVLVRLWWGGRGPGTRRKPCKEPLKGRWVENLQSNIRRIREQGVQVTKIKGGGNAFQKIRETSKSLPKKGEERAEIWKSGLNMQIQTRKKEKAGERENTVGQGKRLSKQQQPSTR